MRTALVFIFIGLALIVISDRSKSRTSIASKALLAPPKELKLFTLGYNESFADSLWLRVIQDIDHCDRRADGTEVDRDAVGSIESSSAHQGQIPAGGWSANDPGRCRDQSWVFSMLDAVTTLAPKFRIPYSAGATILSVVVRDYGGSTVIFERGIKQFPSDWPLQYKAAFHYLYDLGDQKRAAELLVEAGKNGAPQWVYSLAAKLYTAEGQAFLAKSVIEEVIENDPNARFAARLRQRLDEANSVLNHSSAPKKERASGSGEMPPPDQPAKKSLAPPGIAR